MKNRVAGMALAVMVLAVSLSLFSPVLASSVNELSGAKLYYAVFLLMSNEKAGTYKLCLNITGVSTSGFTVNYLIEPMYGAIPDPSNISRLLGSDVAIQVFFLPEAYEAFQRNTTVSGSKTIGLNEALFYISPAMIEASSKHATLYKTEKGCLIVGFKAKINGEREAKALVILDNKTNIVMYVRLETQKVRIEASLVKAVLSNGKVLELDPQVIAKAWTEFEVAPQTQSITTYPSAAETATTTTTVTIVKTTITVPEQPPQPLTVTKTVTKTVTQVKTITVTVPDRSTLVSQAAGIAAVVSVIITLLVLTVVKRIP